MSEVADRWGAQPLFADAAGAGRRGRPRATACRTCRRISPPPCAGSAPASWRRSGSASVSSRCRSPCSPGELDEKYVALGRRLARRASAGGADDRPRRRACAPTRGAGRRCGGARIRVRAGHSGRGSQVAKRDVAGYDRCDVIGGQISSGGRRYGAGRGARDDARARRDGDLLVHRSRAGFHGSRGRHEHRGDGRRLTGRGTGRVAGRRWKGRNRDRCRTRHAWTGALRRGRRCQPRSGIQRRRRPVRRRRV